VGEGNREVEKIPGRVILLFVLFVKYYLSDQIIEDGMARHVAHVREKRNAYQVLIGKCEENRLLGRPGNGWEDN